MIYDTLSTASSYVGMPGWLTQALRFLSSPEASSLAEGRHDLDGDRLFALVQEYETRPPEECRWEAHRLHIDVQYVSRGVERIGVAPLASLTQVEPHDEARDVAFFDGSGDFVTLRPGRFAVLFPHDAHRPCMLADAVERVRKIVIKARLD